MIFWDWTFFLLIPAVLLSLFAQWKVKSTYHRYSQVRARAGLTGAQAAQLLAQNNRVPVGIEMTPGVLSDHYDPRTNTLALSRDVHSGSSLASLGIAAHELGHAMQKKERYWPLALRAGLVPIANFGSSFAMFLFIAGMFAHIEALQAAGILLFSCAVLFTIVTLPVEFDASHRALNMLSASGIITRGERPAVKAVLAAAALTYVAAAVMAISELLRLIVLARSDD